MSDYISRQDAIKAIDDLPNCYNGYSDTYDKSYIIGALEEVPTADVKPVVRGEWMPIKTYWGESGGTYSIDSFKCSKCDRQEAYPSPFCPNCGAEMQGEKDESI